jgi:hypothetical protein
MDHHEARDVPQLPGVQPAAEGVREVVQEVVGSHSSHSERDEDTRPPKHSSIMAGPSQEARYRPHPTRSASHVDINHFDPEGMDALKRTMSRASQAAQGRSESPVPPLPTRVKSDRSDMTLTPADGPFDFEKTLRTVIQR